MINSWRGLSFLLSGLSQSAVIDCPAYEIRYHGPVAFCFVQTVYISEGNGGGSEFRPQDRAGYRRVSIRISSLVDYGQQAFLK